MKKCYKNLNTINNKRAPNRNGINNANIIRMQRKENPIVQQSPIDQFIDKYDLWYRPSLTRTSRKKG